MDSVAITPISDKQKDGNAGPTPGPYFSEPIPADWYTDPEYPARRDDLFQIVDSGNCGEVLAIVQKVAGGLEEAQANARLFGASFELLAAAKSALDTVACIRENWPEEEGILKTLDDWLVRDLRAAIAKAEQR